MNKKLLFGIMSLAALTACTNDEFESQNVAQEESPIQFEVINNDVVTRASMSGNKIVWNANDGDKFTLYHGGAVAGAAPFYLSGCENAIYTASTGEGKAVLKTPSMIKQGSAIMVWPVDSVFRIGPANNISIQIPAEQTNIEKYIPYVSDVVNIAAYNNKAPYNTAGFERSYPVYMRPMASQLIIKADYAGTDNTLASLYTGDDPIAEIEVTSVELLTQTGGADEFTTEIPLVFKAAVAADNARWNTTAATKVANNAWTHVTAFHNTATTKVDKLTSKVLAENNGGCKFLMLPQGNVASGVDDGAVVVNTLYGKVVVASPGTAGTLYTAGEAADAWYRYISAASKTAGAGVGYDATETPAATAEASGDNAGKFKTTSKIENGMMQTINGFSTYTHSGTSPVQTEPEGAAATRYVKVLLTHLDMSDLHIKSDKQLRDAAKVWQKMGLASVTVHLDGNSSKQFFISQQTIKKINEINAAAGAKAFSVTPCNTAGEVCNEIVITGGDKIEDLAFITDEDKTADVVLQTGSTWKWDGTVKVHTTGTVSTGIATIINRGTLENAEDKILNIVENNAPTYTPINIKFKNDVPGKWNITGGRIRVQNKVENFGTVTISKGAQLVEDGAKHGAAAVFTNTALTLENRFIGGSGQRIGKIINNGGFMTLSSGVINNYSLIEHADKDAKTYISSNELGGAFGTAFGANTNMKGRINLPYSNKDEDNISISATSVAPYEGFISVTVDGDAPSSTLNPAAVGKFVNYIIVKSGIDDIAFLPAQVEYLEVDTDHEVYWSVATATPLTGLIVLSDVNVKLGTTMSATVTYLGAEMYVGGVFNSGTTNWNGYYGATGTRVAEHYLTY
jgi:hypothetical protein